MSIAKRIYVVKEPIEHAEDPRGDSVREYLVRASSQSQAISHIVRGRYSAEVASQMDLERLLPSVKVQETGSDE